MEHEYGGPSYLFVKKCDDVLPYVAAHLKVLFSNAVKASRRPPMKRLLDGFVSSLPRPNKLGWVDERNSLALALSHENLTHLSKITRNLGSVVDTTALETEFDFSAEQVAHVCASDNMAAAAFAASRSGYVREMGLSHIDRIGTDIGLALVIQRLNDWVPEVRAEAVKAVERMAQHVDEPLGGPAYNIAGAIGLILDDERFGRSSMEEREVAASLLEHTRVKNAVRWFQINKKSDRTTSQNLQAIIQTGYSDELLPEIATGAKCSHRRLLATRAALSGKYVWNYEGELRERRFEFEEYRTDVLRNALLDPSANVAFAALGYLIESEEFERLDKITANKLVKRTEASLQKRISLLRGMIGN